jgi:hypothetical protein
MIFRKRPSFEQIWKRLQVHQSERCARNPIPTFRRRSPAFSELLSISTLGEMHFRRLTSFHSSSLLLTSPSMNFSKLYHHRFRSVYFFPTNSSSTQSHAASRNMGFCNIGIEIRRSRGRQGPHSANFNDAMMPLTNDTQAPEASSTRSGMQLGFE